MHCSVDQLACVTVFTVAAEVVCVDAMSYRFADHLKNTEYKWPFWKHWCNVVELQPDNAQRVFVSNVLAELVKLSYTER